MSKESALSRYTNATQAVEDHIAANRPVFEAHKKLVLAQIDADNELRDAVAEAGEGISNGVFEAKYAPQEQVVYDEKKILAAAGNISRERAIELGLISINKRPARITISRLAPPPGI